MAESESLTIDMGASMETEEALAIIDGLNDVSDVQAMQGRQVTFIGTRVATMAHVGRLEGIDAFSCPRGFLILFRVPGGPHWCVFGGDLSTAVAAVEDDDLRELVREHLVQHQLL